MEKWKLSVDIPPLGRMVPVSQGHGAMNQEPNHSKTHVDNSATEGGRHCHQRADQNPCEGSGATHNWDSRAGSLAQPTCSALKLQSLFLLTIRHMFFRENLENQQRGKCKSPVILPAKTRINILLHFLPAFFFNVCVCIIVYFNCFHYFKVRIIFLSCLT